MSFSKVAQDEISDDESSRFLYQRVSELSEMSRDNERSHMGKMLRQVEISQMNHG